MVPETAETPAVLAIDLHLTHEVTSPQAFAQLKARGLGVRRPERTLATLDHAVPTDSAQVFGGLPIRLESAARQIGELERNAREYGFELLGLRDARRGIVHVIGPELGLTQPGMTIVCGDSHTSTHGAFGALAFGIGTTEVAHVFATQCLLQRKPKTLAITVEGALRCGRRRERPRARDHRPDRHRRWRTPGDRVPGRDDPRAVDGRAHDGVQHVDRGGRAGGDDRAGLGHLRLPARTAAGAGGRGLRARGRALARACGRSRRRLRPRGARWTRRASSR